MINKKIVLYFLLSLLVTSFILFFLIIFIDREIVFFVNKYFDIRNISSELKLISDFSPFIFLISPVFIFYLLFKFSFFKGFFKFDIVLFLSSFSILVSTSIKSILKYLFSRDNVFMLLNNGHYEFRWAKDFHSLSAFPSGHTIAIVSFFTIFWICYPKYRYLYVIINFILFLTLILLNYHFLSDIIAGFFVGFWVSYFIYSVFLTFSKDEYIDKVK